MTVTVLAGYTSPRQAANHPLIELIRLLWYNFSVVFQLVSTEYRSQGPDGFPCVGDNADMKKCLLMKSTLLFVICCLRNLWRIQTAIISRSRIFHEKLLCTFRNRTFESNGISAKLEECYTKIQIGITTASHPARLSCRA